MEIQELETIRKEYIDSLNQALSDYQSSARKSKRILTGLIFIGIVALYFLLFDLLGGIWGYILTIAVIAIGAYCVSTLGISFKNDPASDGKLSYQACIAMEALVKIKKGTYAEHGVNIIGVSSGKHPSLYKEFIECYPAFASKNLEKLSNVEVEHKDIYN